MVPTASNTYQENILNVEINPFATQYQSKQRCDSVVIWWQTCGNCIAPCTFFCNLTQYYYYGRKGLFFPRHIHISRTCAVLYVFDVHLILNFEIESIFFLQRQRSTSAGSPPGAAIKHLSNCRCKRFSTTAMVTCHSSGNACIRNKQSLFAWVHTLRCIKAVAIYWSNTVDYQTSWCQQDSCILLFDTSPFSRVSFDFQILCYLKLDTSLSLNQQNTCFYLPNFLVTYLA